MSKTKSECYHAAEDKGDTIFKMWLAEDRRKDQGYDLVVFANIKKEFLKEKLPGNKSIDDFNSDKEFAIDLAKERELGKYFHNPKGPGYGAAHRKLDGTLEYVHSEYWLDGKRITDEAEIKKVIHDANFSEKVTKFIED